MIEEDHEMRVGITGDVNEYLIHLFKVDHWTNKDKIRIRVNLRSTYSPAESQVVLQAWSHKTHQWENIDQESSEGADTDFNLSAVINDYQEYYYSADGVVTIRVYQHNDSGSSQTLAIDQFRVFFITAYDTIYQDQRSQYQDKYSKVGNDYSPKYISKGEKA